MLFGYNVNSLFNFCYLRLPTKSKYKIHLEKLHSANFVRLQSNRACDIGKFHFPTLIHHWNFFYQTPVRLIACQLALSSRVMSCWGTGAIVTGCPSCRHQWLSWDLNPGIISKNWILFLLCTALSTNKPDVVCVCISFSEYWEIPLSNSATYVINRSEIWVLTLLCIA